MVFFVCSACGASLKKNQVEKHTYQCRSRSFSCIDCNKDFIGDDYKAHTKCISEIERYSAKGWKPPANHNKGEKKQDEWMSIVQATLDKHANSISPSCRNLLHTVAKHDNVPRKKPKFINFINNISRNGFNQATVTEVWDILEAEWKSAKQPAPAVVKVDEPLDENEKHINGDGDTAKKTKKRRKDVDDENEAEGDAENEKKKKKRKKAVEDKANGDSEKIENEAKVGEENEKKKKKRKKTGDDETDGDSEKKQKKTEIEAEAVQENEKKKKKRKKGVEDEADAEVENKKQTKEAEDEAEAVAENRKKKKKKKKLIETESNDLDFAASVTKG